MTIYSRTAPGPLLNTGSAAKLNQIRLRALCSICLEDEVGEDGWWLRLRNSIRVFRHRLYICLEEPLSSKTALRVNLFLGICNVLSTLTYCLESLPYYRAEDATKSVWYVWEVLLMIIFTLELIVRAPAKATVQDFVFNRPGILIDSIACIPFDIYLFAHIHISILDTRWIRPVRLLRLVKLGNNILDLKLILIGLRRSVWMIALVWALALMCVFSFASIVFVAERGAWDVTRNCYLSRAIDACTRFDSIPISLYFAIGVTSGTGYGDMVPHSVLGRWITMVLMLMAVTIVALTITLFSIQFAKVFKSVKRSNRIETLQQAVTLTKQSKEMGALSHHLVPLSSTCTSLDTLTNLCKRLEMEMKSVRSDIITVSKLGSMGAIHHNKRLGASRNSLAVVSEILLAELAVANFHALDTLIGFTLSAVEDISVL